MSNPVAPVKTPFVKDPDECGAAWRKQGNAGEYFSLSIDITADMVGEKVGLVMFGRKNPKTSDNQPDFRVLKSRRQGVVTASKSVAPPREAAKAVAAKTSAPAQAEPTDDIPF